MHMDPHDLGSVLHCHTPVRLAIRTLPCHLVWWKISPPSQSLWLFINLDFYFCFSNNGSRPGKIRCLCDAASRGYFAVVVLRCYTAAVLLKQNMKGAQTFASVWRKYDLFLFRLQFWITRVPSTCFLWYFILIFFLHLQLLCCPVEILIRGQVGILSREMRESTLFSLLGGRASLNLNMSPFQVISKEMLSIVA